MAASTDARLLGCPLRVVAPHQQSGRLAVVVVDVELDGSIGVRCADNAPFVGTPKGKPLPELQPASLAPVLEFLISQYSRPLSSPCVTRSVARGKSSAPDAPVIKFGRRKTMKMNLLKTTFILNELGYTFSTLSCNVAFTSCLAGAWGDWRGRPLIRRPMLGISRVSGRRRSIQVAVAMSRARGLVGWCEGAV